MNKVVDLTQGMKDVITGIVSYTPDEIKEMDQDKIDIYIREARKRNKLFKFRNIIRHRRRRYSNISPRGSMIAANYRFTFREETNRKIKKIR